MRRSLSIPSMEAASRSRSSHCGAMLQPVADKVDEAVEDGARTSVRGHAMLLRRLVGNFPQAFSHIALVNSARNLTQREKPSERRGGNRARPSEGKQRIISSEGEVDA